MQTNNDLAETPADRRPEPGVFLKVGLAEEPGPHERPQPLPLAALSNRDGGDALRRQEGRVGVRAGPCPCPDDRVDRGTIQTRPRSV